MFNRMKAIYYEFKSLEEKNTWEIDENPKSQPLPTCFIPKIKRNSDGTVGLFKERFLARGNFQVFDEDYTDTYASVVSFVVVRLFIYISLEKQMYIAQLDVKTAFLNGKIKEQICILSPCRVPGRSVRFHKLIKGIYGLKQAHLAFHFRPCEDLR